MSSGVARMPTSLHVVLAAASGIVFPLAGVATAFGHLDAGSFVAIAIASSSTFMWTTFALSRRPYEPRLREPRATLPARDRQMAYLQ